jgi:hypothetical protein
VSPARDVWPGRDGSPGQDVSPGTLRAHSFTRQLPELRSESWTLFPYEVPAISFVSSLRGRMPPCLRSHATDPPFPHAASQPNVYLKSAPSGAFLKIQSIHYDYCTHTKFYIRTFYNFLIKLS